MFWRIMGTSEGSWIPHVTVVIFLKVNDHGYDDDADCHTILLMYTLYELYVYYGGYRPLVI